MSNVYSLRLASTFMFETAKHNDFSLRHIMIVHGDHLIADSKAVTLNGYSVNSQE